jgi:hypothetical protein
MHSSIYDNYIPQTDRIENLTMVGEDLSRRPSAIGSRRFFYHRPARKLYMDVRYGDTNSWDLVFSEEATTVVLDTTNFDKILGPDDSDLQVAMETLDDHIHAAVEITVDSTGFGNVLDITDDEVQHALDTLDIHSHDLGELFDVNLTLPVSDGQGIFWDSGAEEWVNAFPPGASAPTDAQVVTVDYYEVQSDDLYLLVTVADDAEVVLPNATTHDGRAIYIKRTMDSQYDVEVTVTGGGLIEGVGSFFLRRKYDAIMCVAIDDEWYIY